MVTIEKCGVRSLTEYRRFVGAIELPRSECPVSLALDFVGDKWMLLIVRDLLKGKSRYDSFLSSDERISTNVLADRLSRLVDAGILIKKPYQANPIRYEYSLTRKGKDLGPIIKAMYAWGKKHGS